MPSVWAKVRTQAGGKNVHVQVNGLFDDEAGIDWQRIVEAAGLHAGSLRLDMITYAIAEKTEVLLAWDTEEEGNEPHVFLPLAGRGRLDFEHINGLSNTVERGRTGDILLRAHPLGEWTGRRSHFALALDLQSQRT